MIYKATRLIARAMDAEEIKYSVHEQENYSEVSAMFGVKNGPDAVVRSSPVMMIMMSESFCLVWFAMWRRRNRLRC